MPISPLIIAFIFDVMGISALDDGDRITFNLRDFDELRAVVGFKNQLLSAVNRPVWLELDGDRRLLSEINLKPDQLLSDWLKAS